MNDKVQVCLCINKNYLQHFSVAVISLLENVSIQTKSRGINFHILYTDLENLEINKIKNITNEYKFTRLYIYKIDSQESLNLEINSKISVDAYNKIAIPNVINGVNRIIYLDSDIIVNGDIGELYDCKINIIGAVVDPNPFLKKYYNNIFNNKGIGEYFNSGVMLMNLDKLRKIKSSEKIMEYIIVNNGKFHWHDQTGFNYFLHDKFTPLHLKYNFIPSVTVMKNTFLLYGKKEHVEAKKNPLIIHFAGGAMYKPWYFESISPYKYLYFKYIKKTVFAKYKNKISIVVICRKILFFIIFYCSPNIVLRFFSNYFGKKFLKDMKIKFNR